MVIFTIFWQRICYNWKIIIGCGFLLKDNILIYWVAKWNLWPCETLMSNKNDLINCWHLDSLILHHKCSFFPQEINSKTRLLSSKRLSWEKGFTHIHVRTQTRWVIKEISVQKLNNHKNRLRRAPHTQRGRLSVMTQYLMEKNK